MKLSGFESNILNAYGEVGKVWLSRLPSLIDKAARKYNLSGLITVPNLTYNYVASGFQKGDPIVLKIALNAKDIRREAAALRCFDGAGAIRVVQEDEGMLLLERAIPGTTLKEYFPKKDEESISIVCEIMKKLHTAKYEFCPVFPHVRDFLSVLDKNLGIPIGCLQNARDLGKELLHEASSDVLLHGDLHHDNILFNGSEWVAIDPKGVVGDENFEIAAFICNPIDGLLNQINFYDIIKSRITIFANILDVPEPLIAKWCFLKSILAWIWALEDNGDTKYWEKMANIFEGIVDGIG